MTRGIYAYQRDNGFKADGFVNPGGETETGLHDQIGRQRKTLADALEQAVGETVRRATAGDPALKGMTSRAAAVSVAGLQTAKALAKQQNERLKIVAALGGGGLSPGRARRPAPVATESDYPPARSNQSGAAKPRVEPVANKPGEPSSGRDARPSPPPPYPRRPDEVIKVNGVTLFRRTFELYNRVLTATPKIALDVYKAIQASDLPLRQKGILYGMLDGIEDGKRPGATEVESNLKQLRADEHLADRLRRNIPNMVGPRGAARAAIRLLRKSRPTVGAGAPNEPEPDAPPPAVKRNELLYRLVRADAAKRSRPRTGNVALPSLYNPARLRRLPRLSKTDGELAPRWQRVAPDTIITGEAFDRDFPPRGEIDPNRIGTVQGSIAQMIYLPMPDGSVQKVSLAAYVEALRNGTIEPEDVEPIGLYELKGRMVTADNRRLVAARLAGVKVRYRVLRPAELKEELKKVDKTWNIHEVWIRRSRQGKAK